MTPRITGDEPGGDMSIDENILSRIDEIEARLNGVLIYLAAIEAGVSPNLEDPAFREFVKRNAAGLLGGRLQTSGVMPALGFHDAQAILEIGKYARTLGAETKP